MPLDVQAAGEKLEHIQSSRKIKIITKSVMFPKKSIEIDRYLKTTIVTALKTITAVFAEHMKSSQHNIHH